MSVIRAQPRIVDKNKKENNSQKFNNVNLGASNSESGDASGGMSEGTIKSQLFDQMKKSGVLDSLKSQLRRRLYDQLKLKNEKSDVNMKDVTNRLSFKIAASLCADLMKKCDMPYARSVFLPECGLTQEVLTKMELVDVLGMQHDEYIKKMGDTTPLLLDLVEQIKAKGSVNPNV